MVINFISVFTTGMKLRVNLCVCVCVCVGVYVCVCVCVYKPSFLGGF